jgi:tRNA(Ile)-lysidine synthase
MSVVTADVLAQFRRALDVHSDVFVQEKIGLSVSGGGDSIALMHLAARVFGPQKLHAITVDHGLRTEAADEIALAAQQAAGLGIPHTISRWEWNGAGNLQAAARNGRWAAVREWALMHNIQTAWLGHTQDDQVETVLMRLARGSGIDGLTAMYPAGTRDGLGFFSPQVGI